MFIIDNTKFDKKTYVCDYAECAWCKTKLHKFHNPGFLLDSFGMPYYFHAVSETTAVMFCSGEHSSEWYEENKSKVWNRK